MIFIESSCTILVIMRQQAGTARTLISAHSILNVGLRSDCGSRDRRASDA
jgi:hypothetical protein